MSATDVAPMVPPTGVQHALPRGRRVGKGPRNVIRPGPRPGGGEGVGPDRKEGLPLGDRPSEHRVRR
eukprot:7918340-Alexandrium_andersonii.AAC.1